ncbi:hypothetical protein [Nonomuraea coxensis]|nr:hypothetical protein [Nonomuraea coxensis]
MAGAATWAERRRAPRTGSSRDPVPPPAGLVAGQETAGDARGRSTPA